MMNPEYNYGSLRELETILQDLKNGDSMLTIQSAQKVIDSIGCDLELNKGHRTDTVLFLLILELFVDKFKRDREIQGYW